MHGTALTAATDLRIAADYYHGGPAKKKAAKGGGRHVASQAGSKRYGLPIGAPLGHGKAKDAKAKASYDTFMAANTQSDMSRNAGYMSNDDLGKAADAVFSVKTSNARNQAAQQVLVKELVNRGIDPHKYGYDGPPVVLNPSPKKDPVAKAAETAQKATDTASKKSASDAKKAADAITKSINDAAKAAQKQQDADTAAAKKAAKDAADLAQQQARKAIGDALASGLISQAEAREKTAELTK